MHWKAEEYALEAWRWTSKGDGEDWRSSEAAEVRLSLFYSTQATSLLVGVTHTQGGPSLFRESIIQTHSEPC